MGRELKVGGEGKRTIEGLRTSGELRYLSPWEVWARIHSATWPYRPEGWALNAKPENMDRATLNAADKLRFYHARDIALASLLYLSSGRINEVLRVTHDQLVEDEEDPSGFWVVKQFYVSKRSRGGVKVKLVKTGEIDPATQLPIYERREKVLKPKPHPTPDIPLPRVGKLSPFSKAVMDYVAMIGPGEKLFSFSKSRALAIVDVITGGDPPRVRAEKRAAGIEYTHGFFTHLIRAQSFSYQVNTIKSTIAVAQSRGIENPNTLSKYYTGSWREHAEELKK